jgi:hypothetical protein
MATSKPDFPEAQSFSPESYEEQPRSRGCFFYGCLISGVLALLALIAVGIFSYLFYRSVVRLVEEHTATAPRELPKVKMPAAAQRTIKERVESFKKAVDAGEATEPLVLTADEVNALIEQEPNWKGQVYVTIEGDRLKGTLSISLDKLSSVLERIRIGMLRGRYFNGEVELKTTLKDGILNIMIESLEVNERRLPKELVERVKNTTLEFSKDPQVADEIQKIESLEIKDGKIWIKGRATKKGPERGASPPRGELPDDVLAPADPGHAEAKSSKVAAPTGSTVPTPAAKP